MGIKTEVTAVTLQLKSNSRGEEVATVFTTYKNAFNGAKYDGFDVYYSWDEGHVAAAKMVVMDHNDDFTSVVSDYKVNDFRNN
tara:strand:- start:224 stop:472 length:249 start_codon:yes stop_codon:yes gene_type:complete